MSLLKRLFAAAPAPTPEPPAPHLVVPLDDSEIAEFWQGSPLRLYTRAYLKRFCEKNNLTLVEFE